MEYRTLGRTGLKVSAIGLGTEHLEQTPENMAEVLSAVINAGINYIDLLYSEPDDAPGFWDNAAPLLRQYRDRLVLAVHWGPHHVKQPERCERCLDEVLARLGNGYAEVALVASVDTEKQWRAYVQDALERLARYRGRGQIGFLGMSGHLLPAALTAVNSGLIDVLMYGINLVSGATQELATLYEACARQGVGLVAMKPYYGGTLLSAGLTPARCLGYVLSQPVATAVPGPRNAHELQATLHYLDATDEEKEYEAAGDIHTYLAGHCVYCGHCHPCPQKINVAGVIWLADLAAGGVSGELMTMYARHKRKASACDACGACLERCPFGVDVVAKMRRAVELFEGG